VYQGVELVLRFRAFENQGIELVLRFGAFDRQDVNVFDGFGLRYGDGGEGFENGGDVVWMWSSNTFEAPGGGVLLLGLWHE